MRGEMTFSWCTRAISADCAERCSAPACGMFTCSSQLSRWPTEASRPISLRLMINSEYAADGLLMQGLKHHARVESSVRAARARASQLRGAVTSGHLGSEPDL